MNDFYCYQLHSMYVDNVTKIPEDKTAKNSDLLLLNRQIYWVSCNLLKLGFTDPVFCGSI